MFIFIYAINASNRPNKSLKISNVPGVKKKVRVHGLFPPLVEKHWKKREIRRSRATEERGHEETTRDSISGTTSRSFLAVRKSTEYSKTVPASDCPIAPSSLRHLPVQHHPSNRLLPKIVRRRKVHIDKTKILSLPIPQPLRKMDRVPVVRDPTPCNLQNLLPMPLHSANPIPFQQFLLPMNRRKHRLNLFQQPLP